MIKTERKFYCGKCDYTKILNDGENEPEKCPGCEEKTSYVAKEKDNLMDLFSMKSKEKSDKEENKLGFDFL